MKRLIAAMIIAGVLIATMWMVASALPLNDGPADGGAGSQGDAWSGISLMGP